MRRLDIKIVLVLLATVLVPLGFSVYLVANAVHTSLGLGLNAKLASQLEQSLNVQRNYIKEIKNGIKHRFDHMVDSNAIFNAAISDREETLRTALEALVKQDPTLNLIRLTGAAGELLEVRNTGLRSTQETRTLPLQRKIALGSYTSIEALFEVDASITDNYEQAAHDFTTYKALIDAPPNYLGDRFVWVYLTIIGITVMVSVLIGIVWARRVVARIHRLSRATIQVAEGDLSVRVDPGNEDEVGTLVESFNGMVAELAANRARIEYLQKISAWQEMARRLAHEIKNPLTPIQLAAQQLRVKYDGDDPKFARLLEQSTEIISEEVATLRRLTSDFSSFAKLPEVTPEPSDLVEFLSDCKSTLTPVALQKGVTTIFETPNHPIPIMLDRIMLKRVIDNLVRNGVESLVDGKIESPQITVSATRHTRGKHASVEIRISDNGPGVSKAAQSSIFDPYFTTKVDGTGLGLAISKKIVLDHGGRIWLDNATTHGATFIITLPAGPGAERAK